MKKESEKPFSKTRLRLNKDPHGIDSEPRKARIEEMFPEMPPGLDDILFDVSAEPLFPQSPAKILPAHPLKKSD